MKTLRYGTLAFFAILTLAGCAGRQDPVPNGAPAASSNAAIFDPGNGAVPLPNILATASAADPLSGRAVNAPMNPAEALAYINQYEVGGTQAVAGVNAPIYLRFTYPLRADTVTAANIKVFRLTPDAAGTENQPLGFTDVTGLFTFQYPAGGTDLWLFPSFPLAPASRYLYVVSDRVLDAATGAPVIASAYFQLLRGTEAPGGAAAALAPIWNNTLSGTDIALSGYGKVLDDLVAASATTTISARTRVALMGRFITSAAGFILTDPASGTRLPVETALRAFAAGSGLGGLAGVTWDNGIAVTTTFTKGAANPALDVAAYWSAATGAAPGTVPASLGSVVLGSVNAAFLGLDPVVVGANSASMDLSALAASAYNDAAGVLQPFRNGQGALTGFYHVPAAIPFVYLAPADPAPGGGYPLVLYQHGITSQKETVLALAQALTGAGFAALAIDLPEHGALAPANLQLQSGDSAATISAKQEGWGEAFMSIGAPLATRSNVEQAAFNLDRLEFTVAAGGFAGLGAAAPSTGDLHFVGISLGSIVGAYYLAGNAALPYTQGTLDSAMKGLLSVPGGRLAYLIQGSPAFGPTIDAGLAAAGIVPGSPTYHAFFQATQTVLDSVDPATMTTPLAAGLPSRLSGRLLVQEATSTTFDAQGHPTNGDLVITNPFARYFGSALGGEGVLGSAAASAVGPGFFQLGYGVDGRIPSPFLYDLVGGSLAPKTEPAALSPAATAPGEGYFQFDQAGIEHGGLLDLVGQPANAALMQEQMLYFLGLNGASIVVDPTASGLGPTLRHALAPGTGAPWAILGPHANR